MILRAGRALDLRARFWAVWPSVPVFHFRRRLGRSVLAYSFTGCNEGWCYRSARWRCCPQPTSGRRSGVSRAVWLKPLERGWREPHRALGWSAPLPFEGEWAEREYARSTHADGRTRRRLVAMGRAWQEHLGRPLPEIFPGKAEQQAAGGCPDDGGPLLPMLALQTVMHHYEGSGPLAQPDRAADFESAGSGFESSRGRQCGAGRARFHRTRAGVVDG